MGTFRVNQNDYMELGIKDLVLTEPIIWEVKILTHSTAGWTYLGVR